MQSPGEPQPPGGFGAQPSPPMQQQYIAPPASGGSSGGCLVAALVMIPIVGILAVLAIYGVRKFIANAKSAEAMNNIGEIARDAKSEFEATSAATAARGEKAEKSALCPSATRPVPADISAVRANKYQSASNEYARDKAINAGFACLKFSYDGPQYYQYDYQAQTDVAKTESFEAIARGDLDGDGILSTFKMRGEVQNDTLALVLAPSVEEQNPGE